MEPMRWLPAGWPIDGQITKRNITNRVAVIHGPRSFIHGPRSFSHGPRSFSHGNLSARARRRPRSCSAQVAQLGSPLIELYESLNTNCNSMSIFHHARAVGLAPHRALCQPIMVKYQARALVKHRPPKRSRLRPRPLRAAERGTRARRARPGGREGRLGMREHGWIECSGHGRMAETRGARHGVSGSATHDISSPHPPLVSVAPPPPPPPRPVSLSVS